MKDNSSPFIKSCGFSPSCSPSPQKTVVVRKVSAMVSSVSLSLCVSEPCRYCGPGDIGGVELSSRVLSVMFVNGESDREWVLSSETNVNGDSDRDWGSGDGTRERLGILARNRPAESRRCCEPRARV